jgi:hypothetical protein
VQYLFGSYKNRHNVPIIPSIWSQQGKDLLTTIRGDNLQPNDLTDVTYQNHCTSKKSSSTDGDNIDVLEFAFATVVSRGWTDKLIPVLDLMNHRGGRYFNIDTTSVHDVRQDAIEAYATRPIKRGEQLHISFMDCAEEHEYRFEYVLPQLLRDIGFVDQYPQRWIFPTGVPDDESDEYVKNVVIDIDQVTKKSQDGEVVSYEISWHVPDRGLDDGALVLETLREELSRLEELKTYVYERAIQIQSEHERKVSLEYYRSLTVALEQVIANIIQEFGDHNDVELEEEKKKNYRNDLDPEWKACDDFELIWKKDSGWKLIEGFNSFHQVIDIYHHPKNDDACLTLGNYLHACASNRPVSLKKVCCFDETKNISCC